MAWHVTFGRTQLRSPIVLHRIFNNQEALSQNRGRQFYHFVQSFAEGDRLTPQLANAIGVELAEKEFPDFEVLVATHIDTGHLHNHLIVNSVSYVDGRKLHQNTADLQHHRDVNGPDLHEVPPECSPEIEKA